ncbi:MAG TPA: sigma-70 family RNA polymerase sigma factor [Solirubrobacterales bacterium]|nr:sigma-70 family RNA polymerase sigma factor [Solirubrobacterales bacterium]
MPDPSSQVPAVAPPSLDSESARWLAALRGSRREAAVAELHGRLRKIAGAEVSRRHGRIPFGGPELDDVVTAAADDATVAVLAKLDDFRGESRFTTWAAKFAILEVSNKVGRHLWRAGGVHLDPDAWERMPDRFGLGPGREAETREVLAGLRRAVATELSERQRRVFEAIVLNEVPLDVLTVELDTNRNAIYKTLFDARRKLRAALVADDLVDP